MPQRVLLFASWADAIGASEIEVELPPGGTVGQVLDLVRSRAPADALLPQPAVAVNLRYARAEHPVTPGDEVAIIPPVAGG